MKRQQFRNVIESELERRQWSVFRLSKEASVNYKTLGNWMRGQNKTLNSDAIERVLCALELQVTTRT